MFLPCDLRDWVPAGHIVHLILEAVAQVPTTQFRVNHPGQRQRAISAGDDAGVADL